LDSEHLTLCVTTDILLEYEEIIIRRYGDPQLATLLLDAGCTIDAKLKVYSKKIYFLG
jgi:hypothetical protein